MPTPPIPRRRFLAGSAAVAAVISAPRSSLPAAATQEAADETLLFRSDWANVPDRVWIGPQYWANPLQDWRVAGGRLECARAARGRSLHILTHQSADHAGDLRMTLRLGSLDTANLAEARGEAGFSVGVRGPLEDYRNNLVHGQGLHVGLRASGELFIGNRGGGKSAPVNLAGEAVALRLEAEPEGEDYRVRLSAYGADAEQLLGEVERSGVPAEWLVGNLALAANYTPPGGGGANRQGQRPPGPAGRWWFSDWTIAGSKVAVHEQQLFGPILFNHYTLHRGILKMTAQMPPIGDQDQPNVQLQIRRGNDWETVAEAAIEADARIAVFRVERWNDGEDVPYRLAYGLRRRDGSAEPHFLEGVVRRDPVDRDELTVADISCNAHFAFPNKECVAGVAKLDPDLIAFTGDQYYESTGGFGVERETTEIALLDGLRKWYQHGWTWRELLKDRPSVSIPDDHDVYHGNLWGEGGVPAPGQTSDAEAKGGYKQMPEFVNAVHSMQTSHHPDSPAEPGAQGITGYFGPLVYGGVSFAILADRQYKSGPDGKTPPTTTGRGDHVLDEAFDPAASDLPGLEMLGAAQEEFLRQWVTDWRGAEMKAAISQTPFTAMATHHGPRYEYLTADYDANGWPQSPRNVALRELRRALAFHLTGDQHLPAVVHYGIDQHRDGPVAFVAPAVNNLYPRWFDPAQPDPNRPPGARENLGDFIDGFGHPMTVLACANPQRESGPGVLQREMDRSSGFGLVRFNKRERTITIECWPLLADPTRPQSQFTDWPVVISQWDSYARPAVAHLPEVTVRGIDKPVIEVIDEATGELIYSLRLPTATWRPHTFTAGPHTLRIRDADSDQQREMRSLIAVADNAERLDVE